MTTAEINQSLYRPILEGTKYDDLVVKTGCPITNLTEGNTKVAINEMAKEAKKYAYQVKDLASVFDIQNLKTGIDDIQWFLFNHISYNIDGKYQDLRTPSCLWASREKGADCKSYSMFASAILLNLGVKHYLRRIKQEAYNDAFTHVYVVIPKNQDTGKLPANAQFNKDYFIIDGTIEYNNELPFKDKDDIFMEPSLPIRRLGAPGLGCGTSNTCSCNNDLQTQPYVFLPGIEPINNTPVKHDVLAMAGVIPVDEQAIMEEAFGRFFDLLNTLEANGIPKSEVNKGIDNLKYFINIGVEPTLGELLGIDYMGGLGIVPLVAAGGASGGTGIISGVTSFIGKLIPKDFLSKTFGAIFANGFNLSCWNSTFTPAKVTAEVQKYQVPFFETALQSVRNASSTKQVEEHFNYLLKASDICYTMYAEYMKNGANWRSCSKEAIDIYIQVVTGAKTQVESLLSQFKNQYGLSITTKTVPAEFTFPKEYTGQPQDFSWSEKQHGNATYRIVKFQSNIEDTLQNEVVDSYIDENGDVVFVDANGNQIDPNKSKPQTAGFGIGTAVILAGIAFGAWKASKKMK